MMRKHSLCLALFGGLLLTVPACGGGGDQPSTAATSAGGASATGSSAGGSSTTGSSTGGTGGGANAMCPTAGAAATHLSVSGAQILDLSGKPVSLRGWNWGQWGSVQDQDAADNAHQGASVVRIPLRWWGPYNNEDMTVDPKIRVDSRDDDSLGHIEPMHLAALDEVVIAAACQGLWIDLFVDSNCGQASVENDTVAYCGQVPNGDPKNFLNSPEDAEKFAQLWEFLAKHYQDMKVPFIGMYEILPEPNLGCDKKTCKDYSAAPTFYAPIIKRIRAIDPTVPILVGPDGGYDVKQIATSYIPGVDGLIYTGNFLGGAAQHPEYVAIASDFSAQKHVPLFIQQVGLKKSEVDAAKLATTILQTLNSAGIGWAWWTYRETKQPNGLGYAPFYQNNGGPWSEDTVWRDVITSELQ